MGTVSFSDTSLSWFGLQIEDLCRIVLDEFEVQIARLPVGLNALAFEFRRRARRKAALVGPARQLVADQEMALGVLKDIEGVVDGMKCHLNVPAAGGSRSYLPPVFARSREKLERFTQRELIACVSPRWMARFPA